MPTILHFHGGPDGCWAPGGTMDSLLLTAHGYRIAMPNLRGSTTHGRAWIEALAGQWGMVDAEDVHAVADALVARRLADPDRMGLMGLSYGGYLVQWMVGVTDRFAAAVAENGVGNVLSDWGESYFGVHYHRQYGQGDPLTEEGAAELWRQSPLRNAAARPHAPADPPGGGGPQLPARRQRAAVRRPQGARPRSRVRPVPRGAPRAEELRAAGPADRPHGAAPGLVRSVPAPALAGAIGQAGGAGGTEGGGDFRASRWASPPTVRARPRLMIPSAPTRRNASPPNAVASAR